MKKILSLMVATAAVFAFAPTETPAGETYRSRTHSRCGHCGHSVLAFYQPVRTIGTRSVYNWVPRYHGTCNSRGSAYRHVYGASSFRFSFGSPNRYNYGYGAGVVPRSGYTVGIHRTYPSGRTISTYPGWRYSALKRCR